MSTLTKPYLKIPLYGWLIGGVVLVGSVVYFVKSRSATSANPNATSTSSSGANPYSGAVGGAAIPTQGYSPTYPFPSVGYEPGSGQLVDASTGVPIINSPQIPQTPSGSVTPPIAVTTTPPAWSFRGLSGPGWTSSPTDPGVPLWGTPSTAEGSPTGWAGFGTSIGGPGNQITQVLGTVPGQQWSRAGVSSNLWYMVKNAAGQVQYVWSPDLTQQSSSSAS